MNRAASLSPRAVGMPRRSRRTRATIVGGGFQLEFHGNLPRDTERERGKGGVANNNDDVATLIISFQGG